MNNELQDELLKLIKRVNSPEGKPGFFRRLIKTLNSPFTITVIGGLAIASITESIQARAINAAEKREHSRKLWQSKLDFFTVFSNGIQKYLSLLIEWSFEGATLIELSQSGITKSEEFIKSEANYVRLKKELLQADNIDSLCARAKAIFKNPSTQTHVDEIASIANKFLNYNKLSLDQIAELQGEANEAYKNAISSLANELADQD
ncbi:MAG: hypothetical protein AAGA58_09690 [Verrucomicrobiota bacterium]